MELSNEFLNLPIIKIFVYGTLRKGQRLGFYLNGAEFVGKYYTEGQLMKAENGSVYIDFAYNNVVTIGEVYMVDFFSLQRINHLEVFSGEFPRGYELNVLPIWPLKDKKQFDLNQEEKEWAFFYKRKNHPMKILTGDYIDDFQPIEKLEEILLETKGQLKPIEILEKMRTELSIFESLNF